MTWLTPIPSPPLLKEPTSHLLSCGWKMATVFTNTLFHKENEDNHKTCPLPQSSILECDEGISQTFPHTLLPWVSNRWLIFWTPMSPPKKKSDFVAVDGSWSQYHHNCEVVSNIFTGATLSWCGKLLQPEVKGVRN